MKLKLCPTIIMAVVNQNIIRTFYCVNSVNRLDIVLFNILTLIRRKAEILKRKAGIIVRSYVRLFMSYPSKGNLKVRVKVRTIRSMLII